MSKWYSAKAILSEEAKKITIEGVISQLYRLARTFEGSTTRSSERRHKLLVLAAVLENHNETLKAMTGGTSNERPTEQERAS